MGARHTNSDLFRQWEEAEEKAEKWEAKAREERELRKREVADVKAEMRAILAEYKEETKIQIESLKRENTELRHKVNLLEDENKRLKSKIDQNSNNSSQPPSTDKKAVRKANEYNGRSKSERNPGGQTGHKGKTLSKKDVEKLILSGEVEHRIEKYGHHTTNDRYEIKYRIDTEISTVITECRFYPDESGKIVIPEEYRSDVTYGNGVRALAVELYSVGVVSNERIRDIIMALTRGKIALSQGTIYHFIRAFADLATPIMKRLRQTLLNKQVLCTDATVMTNNGVLNWVRNISSQDTVVYSAMEKKNIDELKRLDVLNEFAGTLVHDHETALYHFGLQHGECNVHLLRYLTKNIEDTGNSWAMKMRSLLCEMNEARKQRIKDKSTFSEEEISAYERAYCELINLGRQENHTTKPKWAKQGENSLLNRLEKYMQNHLLFLRDFAVPFDDNMSERDLRKCKNRQKMAGGFRSFDGLNMFCSILTVVETAKRRSINPFTAIFNLLDGKPLFLQG